jgi:hypothetical protein
MSKLTEEQKKLLPSNPIIKEATLKAFKAFNGIDMVAAENFLSKAEDFTPPPIKAIASFTTRFTMQCISDYNCKFNSDFWGPEGECEGFLITSYDKWETFFQNATGFIIQSSGSIQVPPFSFIQVTFFSNIIPVGQFNCPCPIVGNWAGGGLGKWTCS